MHKRTLLVRSKSCGSRLSHFLWCITATALSVWSRSLETLILITHLFHLLEFNMWSVDGSLKRCSAVLSFERDRHNSSYNTHVACISSYIASLLRETSWIMSCFSSWIWSEARVRPIPSLTKRECYPIHCQSQCVWLSGCQYPTQISNSQWLSAVRTADGGGGVCVRRSCLRARVLFLVYTFAVIITPDWKLMV